MTAIPVPEGRNRGSGWQSAEVAVPTFRGATIAEVNWKVDEAITPLVLPEAGAPGGDGVTVGHRILEELPEGVTFDEGTRTLSGTPTEHLARTAYTYRATAGRQTTRPFPRFETLGTADLEFHVTVVPDVGSAELSASDGPVIADGVDAFTLTLTLEDGDGDGITGLADAVTLDSDSAGDTAEISDVTDNGDGTYVATVTDTAAETVTVTATVPGVPVDLTAQVTFAEVPVATVCR